MPPRAKGVLDSGDQGCQDAECVVCMHHLRICCFFFFLLHYGG